MPSRALVTGITGQDGSYLAEHLVASGYEVWGMVRGGDHSPLPSGVRPVIGDLTDGASLASAIEQIAPREIYNLAAISFVGASFARPLETCDVTATGVLRLLEAMRAVDPGIRLFQASSSEVFGRARETPQTESTPFHPRSPYGVAKAFAHHIVVNYRESYGMHVSNGILFSHESPRRGVQFVTRKITRAVARIKHGLDRHVTLGSLDAVRDWGFAGDYVRAMHLMLQQDTPDDYVLATGETHSLEEFLHLAFARAGLDWHDHVVTDPALVRPAEPGQLIGDARRARERLGWTPTVGFEELVTMMVDADLAAVAAEGAAESA